MISKNPLQPRQSAETSNPIARAVALDVALCLLGLVLYFQTGTWLWLLVGAIVGSAIVVRAALAMRAQRAKQTVTRKSSKRPAFRRSSDSNVIPFKRKTTGTSAQSPHQNDSTKSNWPSA